MQALIRFLQWAVSHHPRKIVLLHFVFVVITGILGALHLRVDTTIDGLMSSSDPDFAAMHALKSEFSNDEVAFIAIDLGHPFTRDDLARLTRLTQALEQIPSVTQVTSLTNVEDVRGDGAGGLDASPLVDVEAIAALDDGALETLRKRVAEHPLYIHNIVSPELDVVAAVVSFEPPGPGKLNIRSATEAIEALVAETTQGWGTAWVAGYPLIERESDRLVKQDLFTLAPFVMIVMLGIFYGIARRLFSVILLCTLALWTAAVAVLYFVIADVPINIITSAVPPILLTTSAVYGIFLLGLLQTMQGMKDPAINIIEVATRPSFLSMSSTVVGFLSMLFIHVDALQEMGVGLALGTIGSFLATLLLLPALVQLADFRAPPVHWRWVERFSTLGVRLARRPWRVIIGVSLLVALAVPGLTQLYIDTNPLDYFRESSYIIRSHAFVRERLGGAGVLSVVVRTDRPDGALTPEVQRLAEALCEEADRHDMVDHTLSLLDYQRLMDVALRPGEPPRRVFGDAATAAQYLLLFESGGDASALAPYINADRSALMLRVRVRYLKSNVVLAFEERLAEVAAKYPDARAEVRLLSSANLLARSADSISEGLIPGFGSALLVVLFTFWFTLGSLKLALIAIPPNILPYCFCMAALGYADIPISVGSSLVGFIAIGLAVDDTAHLLSHLRGGHSMKQVYAEVGMPVLLTSMALGAGFLVLSVSSFQVIAVFGIATGITLATAVLADIILLPSVLTLFGYSLEDAPATVEAEAAPERDEDDLREPAGEPG